MEGSGDNEKAVIIPGHHTPECHLMQKAIACMINEFGALSSHTESFIGYFEFYIILCHTGKFYLDNNVLITLIVVSQILGDINALSRNLDMRVSSPRSNHLLAEVPVLTFVSLAQSLLR